MSMEIGSRRAKELVIFYNVKMRDMKLKNIKEGEKFFINGAENRLYIKAELFITNCFWCEPVGGGMRAQLDSRLNVTRAKIWNVEECLNTPPNHGI